MEPRDMSIFGLDVDTFSEAKYWVELLSPYFRFFKIGLELFTAVGPSAVEAVHGSGNSVFLDLKYNDIPETVGRATAVASRLGVSMLTVHASAGIPAMQQAVANKGEMKILATTVLTSINDAYTGRDEPRHSCNHIFGKKVSEKVFSLVWDAVDAGCDGITCSARDIKKISGLAGLDQLVIVTPGIRDKNDPRDDQKRIMTAEQAIIAGADYLVISRPILQHKDPVGRALRFSQDVARGLEMRSRRVR